VAGLIGGAIASAFHGLFTEPVIDRAIAAEKGRAAAQPGHHGEEPVVSRRAQKIGLVAGLLLYGATWGLLVGLAVHATQGWAPRTWSSARHGAVLAGLLGWSVAIFPSLKYPANPPGVGDPASIGYRQTLYVGFIALAVLGLALAAALGRRTGGWLAPALLYAAWASGLYVLMPANPDPVPLFQAIVGPFRALSLAGLAIFWAALCAGLAVLGRDRIETGDRLRRPNHA
jgi:hypothetical protein